MEARYGTNLEEGQRLILIGKVIGADTVILRLESLMRFFRVKILDRFYGNYSLWPAKIKTTFALAVARVSLISWPVYFY